MYIYIYIYIYIYTQVLGVRRLDRGGPPVDPGGGRRYAGRPRRRPGLRVLRGGAQLRPRQGGDARLRGWRRAPLAPLPGGDGPHLVRRRGREPRGHRARPRVHVQAAGAPRPQGVPRRLLGHPGHRRPGLRPGRADAPARAQPGLPAVITYCIIICCYITIL